MRQKAELPYRVVVGRLHRGAKPFGWLIYRRGQKRPVVKSETGYDNETDAWSAGGGMMNRLEREPIRPRR